MRGEGAPCAAADAGGPSLVMEDRMDSHSGVGGHEHHNGSGAVTVDAGEGKEGSNAGTVAGQSPNQDPNRGRLKFFKDGKFILELSWERETESWHQVAGTGLSGASRGSRTVWIPTGGGASGSVRSTASVSGASDNTSDEHTQLSPLATATSTTAPSARSTPPLLHREDHCWKQHAPRRRRAPPQLQPQQPHVLCASPASSSSSPPPRVPVTGTSLHSLISAGPLTGFAMQRPAALSIALRRRRWLLPHLRRLRRRPFDPLPFEEVHTLLQQPFTTSQHHPHLQSPVNGHGSRVTVGGGRNKQLAAIVLRLRESAMLAPGPPAVFSPRKRILRELERVSLACDAAEPAKKLSCQQTAVGQTSYLKQQQRLPTTPTTNHSKPSVSKSVTNSSYSITSLLGGNATSPPPAPPVPPLPTTTTNPPPPFVYYPQPFFLATPPAPPPAATHHPLWSYPHPPLVGRPYPGIGPPTPFPPPPPAPPPNATTSPSAAHSPTVVMYHHVSPPATPPDLPLNLSKHGGG